MCYTVCRDSVLALYYDKTNKENTVMGLFGKKKKEPEKAQQEKLMLNSPLGTFTYINNPNVNEFGYEGYIDWYDGGIESEITTAYIDTDSPDITRAELCYARLEELFADKDRVENEITERIADHFLRSPDMIASGYNKQMIMDDMQLIWLGVFRNGDVQFSFDDVGIYASDISVTIHADGSREIEYIYEYEKHIDKM
ncbi:hypothetical protein [Ruminococcus sp. FC2018]|uniref:hypothetical protein n=1 Tax=Ruminococcus sp. FC2018 TaxID=1410617 RepID=UPI0012DD2CFD|nr:hypothetical protein [Ruminococcus sp. FC2018]